MAAERQLARARAQWGQVGKVLVTDGTSTRMIRYFYEANVQAVLSWTILDSTLQQIWSFHSRVA